MMVKGFIAWKAPQFCKWEGEDKRSPQWFPVQGPAPVQRTDVVRRKEWKGLAWVIFCVYLTWGNSWDSLK